MASIDDRFAAYVRDRGEHHLRVAVLLTGDWHAAEDLVQASLVKLYRAWPKLRPDGDPDAYLRRIMVNTHRSWWIMVNTHRSWWRARWRRETPAGELPDTAFNASADTLAYVTVTSVRAGHLIQLEQWWSWPAVPSPGQVQYVRDSSSQIPLGASEATGSVKLTEDDSYTTIVPRPSRYGQDERARLIVVCYAGTGQTGCGWGRFNPPAGTWSLHTAVMPYIDYAPDPRGADLARQIAQGQWRIVGHTRLRGQQAVKLAETPSGHFQRPDVLWVSTTTYLPLRMVWGPATSYEIWNWDYLAPSKANLAQLRVPIPSGYPRSG